MGWAALIPAAISVVSSLAKSGQQQPAGQPQAAASPTNPFPMNFPDGGKPGPSMLDAYGPASLAPQMPGQQQQQPDAQGNFMVPGGGKPLSVVDAFLPGGTSPSIFNPIQDPLQAGLGGLLKGIFK